MFKLKLKNKTSFSVLILLLIFINFSFLISNVLSQRIENVSGFSTQDQIYPNESVKYIFSNNIIFEISTDSFIDLEIQYENKIENRQIFFLVNNSNPTRIKYAAFCLCILISCIYSVPIIRREVDKVAPRQRNGATSGVQPHTLPR